MDHPAAPKPELLRSLGRLVRGLSALFWGLPLALVICAQTAKTDWLASLTVFPALGATGLLFYGLVLLGSFQKQERPWRNALDRALLLALVNFGLSPFLYWWNRMPDHPLFGAMVGALALFAWLFLLQLNEVVLRLAAMLPDEALRHETRQFTLLNQVLLGLFLLVAAATLVLGQLRQLPALLELILPWLERATPWVLLFLILLPLAMTMALIWKTKEVIFDSVFSAK